MPSSSTEADELEHQVAEERARIDRTIGAIQHKLTPGQLIDEGLGFLNRDTSGVVRDLVNKVTGNPVPAALIGVGLVWLILASARRETPGTTSASSSEPDVGTPK